MQKIDLIHQLQTSTESAYNIFLKGYLHHFPMDNEIYQHLLVKITKEAKSLGSKLESYNQNPTTFSSTDLEELSQAAQNLESLVFNVCLSEIQKEAYVSQSISQLQKKISPFFLKQFKDQESLGYEVIEDTSAGTLKIVNAAGVLVFESIYTPMKDILQEWGVDTSHPQYYLLFFTLVPPEDLAIYRKLHLFSIFFKFV